MENKFKRGEVYKALSTISKIDPDWREAPVVLFEKDKIYRCKQNGTLHSYGSFNDEEIDEHSDRFELVGYFVYKMNDDEIRKAAMEVAFHDVFYKNPTFEQFYDRYVEAYRKIMPVVASIDEDEIHYLNGHVGNYWDDHSESKSLI